MNREQQSVFSSEEFKKLKKKKVPVMTEKELTKQVCLYIKTKYPNVYFFTDPSGMFQKSWGAKIMLKNNRSKHAQLDIIVLHPMRGFHGCIIELKREGEKIYKKDGAFKDKHAEEQTESLKHLHSQGYEAVYGIGYEDTIKIIDNYLNQ